MQRQEVFLTEDELKEIWTGAKQTNFDQFCNFFSKGLYSGIQSIQSSKIIIQNELYSAAACANYDKFVQLFEKGIVHVDDYYYEERGGKTFLQLIFELDYYFADEKQTLSRQNIARYLLNKGASINKRSYDYKGTELPSLLEIYNEQLKHENSSWIGIWSPPPTRNNGKNVLAVIKEHLESINQPKITNNK